MSYYNFKFTKGKFELEVNSEDKYFIVSQFDKIYREMIEKQSSKPVAAKPEPVKEEPVAEEKAEVKEEPKAEALVPEVKKEEPAVQEVVEEPVVEAVAPKQVELPKVEAVPETPKAAEVVEEPVKTAEAVEPEVTETVEEVKVEEPAVEEVEEPTIEVAEDPVVAEVAAEVEPEIEEPAAEVEAEETAVEPEEVEETPVVEETKEAAPVVEETKQTSEPAGEKKILNQEEIPSKEAETTEIADDFQKIIEEKLKEEASELETSDIEADEKETITYYEETPSDEELEVADTLRQSFSEEEETPQKNSKVYDILQEKLSVLPEEEIEKLNLNKAPVKKEKKSPSELKFKELDDLLYLKKPQTKLDYLLVTAYFLQETEGKEKYSLKQLNSKVVPQTKEAVDHSVVHEAVAHSYFEVVPDMTGNTDITEYRITTEGIDYVLNEL